MSHTFGNQTLTGFDKTLVLYQDGYMGRPVTVDKNTVTGLQPNAAGRYIIPQGTYLTGVNGSLLENPQQKAIAANVTEAHSVATINSSVDITVKESGVIAYKFSLVKATTGSPVDPEDTSVKGSIAYDASTKKFTITLAVNKSGTIISTYDDVVALINNDITANTFVTAALSAGVKGTTLATVTASDVTTTAAEGSAEVVTGIIDGILLHSTDVTDGEEFAAMMYAGYVNMDNMPTVPSTAVKTALPRITFSRVD